MLDQIRQNYSSDVRLTIISQGRRLDLAKLGPGYGVLRKPASLQAGPAQVVMSVDGDLRTWNVRVVRDTVPFEDCVEFVFLDD